MRASTQCAFILALWCWPIAVLAQTSIDPGFGTEDEELPEGDAPPEGEEDQEVVPLEPEAPVEEEAPEPPPPVLPPPVTPPPAPIPEPPPPAAVQAPSPSPPVAPPPPRVAPRTVVAVVIPKAAEDLGLAIALGDRAAALLGARRDRPALTLEEALDPGWAGARKERIQAGLDGVEAGQGAIEDLDLEAAGATLEEAVNTLLGEYGHLTGPERQVLARGIFAYGASTLFEGNGDQAEDIFLALALLEPEFSPPEGRFPSNVVARYQQAKSGLDQRGTGALLIKTTPPGAAVSVDGAFRGYAPIEVGGLADGFHAVHVERPFARGLGTLAPVTAERVSHLELELLQGAGTELLDRLAPGLAQDESRAVRLGRELNAGLLLVLRLDGPPSGRTLDGLLVDVEAGRTEARLQKVPAPTDPEVGAQGVVAALEGAQAGPPSVATPPPPPSSYTDAEGPPWVWWAVGGAAVLAAAAATVLVVAAGQGDGGVPPGTAIFGF